MELSKIYEQLHGNYEAVLKRMHTEQRIEKYLLRFLDKHFDTLILEALETKDYVLFLLSERILIVHCLFQ